MQDLRGFVRLGFSLDPILTGGNGGNGGGAIGADWCRFAGIFLQP